MRNSLTTTSYLKDFDALCQRIFTKEYREIVQGLSSDCVDATEVDDCIRFMSELLMSPPRLASFVSLADDHLLAGVYRRYLDLSVALENGRVHGTFSKPMTDGELLRAFLIDLWGMYADLNREREFLPEDPPWDD